MTNERLVEKALAILNKKSERALQKAKELILKERFRCEKAKEALKYYVSTWNDTTRPGVLALAHEAVGGKPKEVIPLQIAMLFIDAAMDIHDDIIDKSTTKSSKETLYGKFGEETALLIGNAFLVEGFNHLNKMTEKLPLDKKQLIINAVKDSLFKVIDAHIHEVELRKAKWSMNPKEYFHVLKTKAADIEGHMRVGAIFAGGTDQEIEAISRYGKYLGTLLLIREDFVDAYEPEELTNRVKHECLPLPIIFALQCGTHKKELYEILFKENFDENDTANIVELIYKIPETLKLKRQLNVLKKKALTELKHLRSKQVVDELRLITLSMLEDL